MTFVLNGLLVYPKAMQENLNKTKGLIFSQKTMLLLVNKGFSRKNAYDIIQKNAMKVWRTGTDFKELLLKDKNVIKHVDPRELNACFDINAYLKNVNRIFRKVGV